jgi:hypothetical protein
MIGLVSKMITLLPSDAPLKMYHYFNGNPMSFWYSHISLSRGNSQAKPTPTLTTTVMAVTTTIAPTTVQKTKSTPLSPDRGGVRSGSSGKKVVSSSELGINGISLELDTTPKKETTT